MNVLLLLLIALVVAVFGYRFYAKLLALGIYALNDNYSTPARTQADAVDHIPTNPHFLFGHHTAAIGGLTMVGAAFALVWGWIPVFLWVVVGAAAAGGAYGLASLWLSVRQPGASAYTSARELLGPAAAYAFVGVGVILLLGLNVTAGGIAALLLGAYPQAALPFLALLALGAGLGRYLHGRRESALLPASLVALALLLIASYVLHGWPLAYSGVLQLDVRGVTLVTLDSAAVWMTLLLVFGFFSARAPVWTQARPRSYLTALGTLVVLVVAYAGLVFAHPALTAPEFHAATNAPRVFPWLFVTLAGGTLAGFHFLIANGVSAKQMKREGQARYLGYGGALADGAIALAAVAVVATAFTDTTLWREQYATWSGALDLPRALSTVVEGLARYAAVVGVPLAFARALVALVLIGLSVATLEAGVRVLKHLLLELAHTAPPAAGRGARLRELNERGGLHLAFWLSLLLALTLGRHIEAWWLLFGATNLLYAGLASLVIALALRAAARPALLMGATASFALVLAVWALVLIGIEGVTDGRGAHALMSALLLVAAAIVGAPAARRLRSTLTRTTGA